MPTNYIHKIKHTRFEIRDTTRTEQDPGLPLIQGKEYHSGGTHPILSVSHPVRFRRTNYKIGRAQLHEKSG